MSTGMRQQFTLSMKKLTESDERVVTLLNDIGVFAFRHLKKDYPNRVYNLGIMEQASISIAAGMSLAGLVPVFHTIAPFIVERGYEQLKDDFGYQNINGNFVSVGASYDYSGLGTTHYCPGDVGALLQIPNMQIVIPGTAEEFDNLICSEYDNGKPTYFRLSENSNTESRPVGFGKAVVIKRGRLGTIIAVGTMLDRIVEAAKDIDVSILYYTTVAPFDRNTLLEVTEKPKIMLCEPYYCGGLTNDIINTFTDRFIRIECIGVPRVPITCYGSVDDMDKEFELDIVNVKNRINRLFLEGE